LGGDDETYLRECGLARHGVLLATANRIEAAQKFDFAPVVETFTEELAETTSDYLRNDCLQLPFPWCYFEFGHDEVGVAAALVAEARSATLDGVGVMIQPFLRYRDEWGDLGFTLIGLSNREEWAVHDYRDTIDVARLPATDNDFLETRHDDCLFIGGQVLAALGFLQTPSVHLETAAAPERLNRDRLAKGKPPIYEHRIVKLKASSVTGSARPSGAHPSPRLHWRRGHVRRWQERVIKVRPHLVGDKAKGFVSHDYRAEP